MTTEEMHVGRPLFVRSEQWRREYWALAFLPGLVLYAFDAAQVSLFSTVRAPNVGLAQQLLIMLGFYGLWGIAPRVTWAVQARDDSRSAPRVMAELGAAGFALSAVHLFIIAVALRIMHAPEGWVFKNLGTSFVEMWLGYAGFWFMLYGLACLVIWLVRRSAQEAATPAHAPLARLEVRQNGKTHSLPLADILWLGASGNYVEIHSTRGVFMLRKSLSAMEKELKGAGFIKSHRRALVNAAHVDAIEPHDGEGAYQVKLSHGASAPLGRRRLSDFKALLRSAPSE